MKKQLTGSSSKSTVATPHVNTSSIPSQAVQTPASTVSALAGADTLGTSESSDGQPQGQQGSTLAPPKGFQLQILQMLQGVQSVLPAGSALVTVDGPMSQATMVSELQQMAQAYQAVEDQAVVEKQVRQQLEASLPQFHQEFTAMKNALIGFFKPGSPLLVKFGFKVRAPARPLTAAQKVVKVVKGLATRKLRGTLGPRQKQAVKFSGQVTVGSTLTPNPAPAPAATVPAVAPPAAAAPVVPSATGSPVPKTS
jgi:hypothetical protein